MEENNLEENLDSAPEKHSRDLLDALPSFDEDQFSATPSGKQQDISADETVIVTHEGEAASEDETLQPSTGSFWSSTSADSQASTTPSEHAQASADAGEEETDPYKTTALNVKSEIDLPDDSPVPSEEPVTLPENAVTLPVNTEIDDKMDEEQALNTLVTAPLPEQPEPEYMPTPLASEPIAEGAYSYETNYTQEVASGESRSGGKVLKRVLIGLLAFVAALALIYVVVSLYFTSHFLPNTTVNGEDVSGMAVTDLSSYVSSIGDNYKSQISGDGMDLKLSGSEINLVYDGNAYSKEAAEQIEAWSWPMELNKEHKYEVKKAITFDEGKFNELVGAAIDKVNENSSGPTNATMAYDEASGSFVVVPDALGTSIERDTAIKTIAEGVSTLQTDIKLADKDLVQPTVTKDSKQLLAAIDTVNKMLAKPIKLRIANNDAKTIDKNLMASWLSLNEETKISVNEDAIKEWAQGTLSDEFDTTGTKRSFTRPDGKEITVEGGTAEYDYGWCLDGEALAGILAENLRNGNSDSVDVPMKKEAASWTPGGKDWPNRYIDVDLSEQYVRMYDDDNNLIWESDCVSGNPIYNGGTATGVFFIYLKSSPMELVGRDYDGDGVADYRTWVTYWMPFDGGEGLHDMTSRGAFGGNIYQYNGSHGCVNLPYSAAEQLYQITNVGDVVVVHW